VSALARCGWTKLSDVDDEEILSIAESLGRPIIPTRTGPVVRAIRPTLSGAARANTMSAIYGLGAFPYHTEAAYRRVPPRFVIVYLAEGNCPSRPTLLYDTHLVRVNPEERAQMKREARGEAEFGHEVRLLKRVLLDDIDTASF
jgi:L-asparagine oxygenase